MTARKNGLIGGIKPTWLRRLALIFIAVPVMILGLAPVYIRLVGSALREAFDTFISELECDVRFPNALMSSGWKACWASSWKPE